MIDKNTEHASETRTAARGVCSLALLWKERRLEYGGSGVQRPRQPGHPLGSRRPPVLVVTLVKRIRGSRGSGVSRWTSRSAGTPACPPVTPAAVGSVEVCTLNSGIPALHRLREFGEVECSSGIGGLVRGRVRVAVMKIHGHVVRRNGVPDHLVAVRVGGRADGQERPVHLHQLVVHHAVEQGLPGKTQEHPNQSLTNQ